MKISVYTPRPSVIHGLDIRSRFLFLLFAIPAAGFIGGWEIVCFLVALLIFLIAYSKIGFKIFWDNIKVFVIAVTVALLVLCFFLASGSIIDRIYSGILYSLRFDIFIIAGVLFAMTTNPNDIPQALMKMRIPHRYGIVVMLGFRLYPTLMQKSRTIMDAQRCRGIELKPSFRHPKTFITALTTLLIPLLIATLEAGAGLGDTLSARGYDLYKPITLSPLVKMHAIDYLLVVGGVLLLGCAYLF